MRYTVVLTDEVKARLRELPLRIRREIGHKLFLLEEDLTGSVKKLKGSRSEYRLRVGDYRVLFELEGRTATVYLSAIAKTFIDEHSPSETEIRDCKSHRQPRY